MFIDGYTVNILQVLPPPAPSMAYPLQGRPHIPPPGSLDVAHKTPLGV